MKQFAGYQSVNLKGFYGQGADQLGDLKGPTRHMETCRKLLSQNYKLFAVITQKLALLKNCYIFKLATTTAPYHLVSTRQLHWLRNCFCVYIR